MRVQASKIKHGSAIFDGLSGKIDIPHVAYDFSKGITVEAWVYRKTNVSSNAVRKEGYFMLSPQTNSSITMSINVGGTWQNVYPYASGVTGTGNWYHAAVTYDGLTVKAYLNGIYLPQFDRTISGAVGNGGISTTTIGAHTVGGNLDGSIDEVRIWNYARTAEQIKANYKTTIEPQTGLVAYYKLDGNALDSSGFGNHGTVNGGVSWSIDKPVTGLKGSTQFDGVEDGLETDTNTTTSYTTNFTNRFTAEIWFKRYSVPASGVTSLFRSNGFAINSTLNGIQAEAFTAGASNASTGNTIYDDTLNRIGTWKHLAVSYDGARMYLLINGIVVTSFAVTGDITTSRIGVRFGSNGGFQFFHGELAMARTWNVYRTPAEIYATMFAPVATTATGLVEQWRLDGSDILVGDKGYNLIPRSSNNSYLPVYSPSIPNATADIAPDLEKVKLLTNGLGGSARFDGSSFFTANSAKLSVNPLTQFTMETWAYRTNVSTKAFEMVIGRWGNYISLGANLVFSLKLTSGTQHYMYLTQAQVPVGKWTHLAWTYNAGVFKGLVNGIVVQTQQITDSSIEDTIAPYMLGAWNDTVNRYTYTGVSTMPRLWDRALTEQEIQQNMYKILPATTPNLLEQWVLNGNALGTKGNHGTVTGNVVFEPDAPRRLLTSVSKQPYMLNMVTNVAGTAGQCRIDTNFNKHKDCTDYSIEACININGTGTDTVNSIYSARVDANNLLHLWVYNDGRLVLMLNGTYLFGSSSIVVPLNTWTSVAVTRIGVRTALHINSVENSFNTITTHALPNAFAVIGAHDSAGSGTATSYRFGGNIAYVRVWNKGLTPTELARVQGKIIPIETGLLEQWIPKQDRIVTSLGSTATLMNATKLLPSTAPVGQRSGLKTAGVCTVDYGTKAIYDVQELTVEGWIRVDVGRTGEAVMLMKEDGSGFNGFRFSKNGNNYVISISGSAGAQTTSYSSLTDYGKFVHLTFRYSNITGVMSIALNGVEVVTRTITPYSNWNIGSTLKTYHTSNSNSTYGYIRYHNGIIPLTEIQKNMYSYLPANYPNLIEQWKLNEGIGNIAYGTKGNNGTITGATWTTPSLMNYVGKHCKLPGTTGTYISIPDSESLKPLKALTIEGIIFTGDLSKNGYPVMSRWTASTTTSNSYCLLLENVNAAGPRKLAVGIQTTNGVFYATGTTSVAANTLYHIALTYDGSTLKGYINAVLECSIAATGDIAYPANIPVALGKLSNLTAGGAGAAALDSSYHVKGNIDSMRMWRIARTPTELLDYKDRDIDRHPDKLLDMGFESGYWDASGYGNHGTAVGTPVIEVTDNEKLLLNAPIN